MSRTSCTAGRATIDSPRVGDARTNGGGGDRTISAVGADGPIGAPAIPPQAVGAAVSKLISATIGEIAVIFSRSPAHKHHTFADLEWMVLPAVLTGQVYVAEMMHNERGGWFPKLSVLK